jgi:hypothetical protein
LGLHGIELKTAVLVKAALKSLFNEFQQREGLQVACLLCGIIVYISGGVQVPVEGKRGGQLQ